jgi:uncharacterized repeat protein (TIGR02543 family)
MFKLKRLLSLLTIILSLTLISCGGGGMVTENVSFRAKFTVLEYEVSYYDENGQLYNDIGGVENYGDITLPARTKVGHTFDGWLKDNTGFPINGTYVLTENVSFHAKFTVLEYEVSYYDENGQLYNDIGGARTYGDTITLPAKNKKCYNFDGWLLNGSGQPFTGSYKVEGDLRFYAKFSVTEIRTPQEFNSIRNNLLGNYKLINNISLSAYSYGNGWIPIGNDSTPFTGCLYGNGFKITDLFVDVNGSGGNVYAGLFGYINGGEISNVRVEADSRGVNVNNSSGSSVAGIIAGYVRNDKITDSYATGDVTSTASIVSIAGGLVGYMYDSSITNSFATGEITADSYNSSVGGLVGRMSGGSITYSYAIGDVTAVSSSTDYFSYAGGLVGVMSNGSITSSYATGSVTLTFSRAGGLVGSMDCGRITNSVAAKRSIKVIQVGFIGRIVGTLSAGCGGTNTVTNNFALKTMQAVGGSFDATPAKHGIDKTEEQLKDQSTYETDLGWQFGSSGEAIWKMPSGGGYPILYWQ